MQLLDAIWLGIIQGLTEFLPVSSSGHLRLMHAWLNTETEGDLFFDILLHIGTLVAVGFVYRETIVRVVKDAFAHLPKLVSGPRAALEASEGLRYVLLAVIATLPTGVAGVLMSDTMDSDFFSPTIVGGLLLLNGAMLWSSRYSEGREVEGRALSVAGIGPREALFIGIAQSVAILPGISRSGMTIVTALFLGAQRMKAAEFSFLISIPAIAGALVLKLTDGVVIDSASVAPYAAGALISATVGVVALLFLLRLVKKAQFHHFAFYCWALGLTAIVLAM